jgi:beta-xylosidase
VAHLAVTTVVLMHSQLWKPRVTSSTTIGRETALPDGNPVIKHKYTTDPTAIVHDRVVYLYTGHDEAPADVHDYVMNEWLCFSTVDLVTWTEHPVPLRASDFAWSSGKAYASKVIEHDGVFYWFVSVADAAGDSAIGLAASTSPSGPFADLLGAPLITRSDLPSTENAKANLDPTVIIVDGTPHLIWGNGCCYSTQLTADLRRVAGPITTIELPAFVEGAHLHRRDDWYYLSYGYGMPERVAYAMSRRPEGPWSFAGLLNEVAGNCETNRPCTLDVHGEWYFVYHNGALPGGNSHHRSVCIDHLQYNPEGTMKPVVMTSRGIRGDT